MDKHMEETVLKVADYSSQEKMLLTRKMHVMFLAAILAYAIYMVLEIKGLADVGFYETIASFALGWILGMLLLGALYTSRHMAKIRAFKMRLLY